MKNYVKYLLLLIVCLVLILVEKNFYAMDLDYNHFPYFWYEILVYSIIGFLIEFIHLSNIKVSFDLKYFIMLVVCGFGLKMTMFYLNTAIISNVIRVLFGILLCKTFFKEG